MYYFLQFRPDKKEAWRKYTVEQLKNSELPGPPAFQTVLMLDQDPEEVADNELDPIDTVKYFGPMYFDFDHSEDIDRVLVDVNLVLDYLINKLNIPEQYISCWLSGGKGVHITVPGQIFGLKSAQKYLPMIYKEIMLTVEAGAGIESASSTVDHSVYSCGRGRMWRCEGIPRPGSGTYKIATSVNELSQMDSDEYHTLVSSARPKMLVEEPPKNLTTVAAEQLFKAAKVTASRKVRAMKEAVAIPSDLLREWDGIPGCVDILITKGDSDGSNWNQAAMQLASYIGARYTPSEESEFMLDLVKPFAHNVHSSSRPDEMERVKHVKSQLARAFRGTLKLSSGAFIAAIGTKCGNCPICRTDMAKGEAAQGDEAGPTNFDTNTKIRFDERGYWMVAENGSRHLTSFQFWPTMEVYELVPTTTAEGLPSWSEGGRVEIRGYVIDDEGRRKDDVRVPEKAWGSKRDFISAFKGFVDSMAYCGDADIQKLLKAVLTFARDRVDNREIARMTRANVCGIIFDRSGPKTVAHYVEAENSITTLGGRSPYRFSGNPRQSPALLKLPNPREDDQDLAIAINAMARVNEPVEMAKMIGWFAACHFREHIQFTEPQFPLLNIYGNAEAGKTSLAMLLGMINGIDYTKAEFQNVEVGTLFPLMEYVSSSTTVPRLIEEVNPSQLGARYDQIVGLLKASWNHAPIQRGRLKDKELVISENRVSAPLVYTSEQSAIRPALRTRSVEVRLQAKSLENETYKENYRIAVSKRESLLSLAKGMVTVAMGTSPAKLLEIFHSKDDLINANLSSRPRWCYKTCLTGLHMMMLTMDEFKIGGKDSILMLYNELVKYLGGQVVESERGKSSSEVDRVIATMNTLADSTMEERVRLIPGLHYWKQGNSLYLVLQSCLPKYLGYCRSIGEMAVIKDFHQMRQLLEGEVYFERKEAHPTRDAEVFVINIERLTTKGTALNNFVESEAVEEV